MSFPNPVVQGMIEEGFHPSFTVVGLWRETLFYRINVAEVVLIDNITAEFCRGCCIFVVGICIIILEKLNGEDINVNV